MIEQLSAFNPFAAWASAGLTATRTALEIVSATGAANAALWGAALAPSQDQSFRPPPPRAEPARSWYRAPYRSPFDPMFWLSPGHPQDHVVDWLAMARNMAPWIASLQQPLHQPWAMGGVAAGMPSPFALPLAGNSNVIDFTSAYAAYRTAGGHAAAQIQPQPFRGRAELEPDSTSALNAWEWFNPYAAFGWMPPR